MESLANRVRLTPTADVDGVWYRHSPARHAASALDGRLATSRWGRANGFPVLHLGRPTDSVVVEAYRHLVDPIEDPDILERLAPRVLVTCRVQVTNLLDLRTATTRVTTQLDLRVLQSSTEDRDAYSRCQDVAGVARQLGLHGIVAPAATGIGETLALFIDRLPEHERPVRLHDDELWSRLPTDPRSDPGRHLRIVRD